MASPGVRWGVPTQHARTSVLDGLAAAWSSGMTYLPPSGDLPEPKALGCSGSLSPGHSAQHGRSLKGQSKIDSVSSASRTSRLEPPSTALYALQRPGSSCLPTTRRILPPPSHPGPPSLPAEPHYPVITKSARTRLII